MLNAIAPLPFHVIHGILVLVPELHGDLIVLKGKEFFAKEVAFFSGPFLLEKLDNGGVPGEETVTVAPDGVVSICGDDSVWISRHGKSVRRHAS